MRSRTPDTSDWTTEETLRRAYAQTNQDIAIRLCDSVLEGEPGNIAALYHRAVLYTAKQQWNRAIMAYEAAIVQSPEDPSLNYNAGVICLHDDRIDEAEHFLREARRLDPECEGAHLALAKIARIRGNLGVALELAEAALRLRPTDCTIGRSDFLALIDDLQRQRDDRGQPVDH